MITDCQGGHALAHRLDNPATFVTEDRREHTFRVFAGQGKGVSVTDTGGNNAHPYFAGLRWSNVELDDFQRLTSFKGDCGAGLD